MTIQTKEQAAWANRTPISGMLPEKAYRDNPVVNWVTAYSDEVLSLWQDTLSTLHLQLDPSTCPEGYLDYVAYLFGLSYSPYWVTSWSSAVKRAILLNQAYLKKYRGTKDCIAKVLAIQGLTYCYWQDEPLLLPFRLPGKFGAGRLRVFILLPKLVSRTGREWREAKRTLQGYCPAMIETKVAYQGFLLGRSKLGEPMFPKGTQFLNVDPAGVKSYITI